VAAEFLKRRIGPWPVWTWGAIGVTGAGLGLLLRRSSLFGDSEPEPAAEDTEGGDGQYLERPTLNTDGAVPLPVVNAPQTTNRATTNLEWGRRATEWLIAQNVPPVTAAAAVQKYLEGVALTAAEAAALALALRQLGTPPEGAPVPQGPAPTTPTVPTDPRGVPRPGLKAPSPVKARGDKGGAWLGWAAVPGATSYWVRSAVAGSGEWSSWSAHGASRTTTFARVSVRRRTSYAFQVRAMKGNTAGAAARSNTVTVSPA
jgi:hypothetical protein